MTSSDVKADISAAAAGQRQLRVWTVSEAKAGTLTQCLGVARLLAYKPRRIIIKGKLPSWRQKWLSPYDIREESQPELIVSCGWGAASHVAAIAAACSRPPVTVHLAKPPPEFADFFDLVYVSRHDWADAMEAKPNFRRMIGVPHQISRRSLDATRAAARSRWVPDGAKALTVLTGGSNRAYAYTDAVVDGLRAHVRKLAGEGWTILVSTSRRSPPSLLARLLEIGDEHIKVWDRMGDNPYAEFLAAADAFLVTKDSITMTCEAVTAGRPTYIYDLDTKPGAVAAKFELFHRDMSENLRLTRLFAGEIADYRYDAPAEAERIASEVKAACAKRSPIGKIGKTGDAEAAPTPRARTRSRSEFAKAFEFNQQWLRRHRLLDRPWLILGSAPNPSFPPRLPPDTVHAHVRFAGRSARLHGLPPGDITLLPRWKDAQRSAALDLDCILRLRRTLTFGGRLNRLLGRHSVAESEMDTSERDDYVLEALGSLFAQEEKRPSNGVALVCFALVHGIPEIIVSGISLISTGHEYEPSLSPRRHILEDRAAFRAMAAKFPSVSTTEESLIASANLPRYSPEPPAR